MGLECCLGPMGIVFPAERDLAVLEGEQARVGDGDAMGVAGQVMEDVFGSAEGWLGVNDPVLPERGTAQSTKSLRILKGFLVPVESEFSLVGRLAGGRPQTSPETRG
jgi:hypothetical protein